MRTGNIYQRIQEVIAVDSLKGKTKKILSRCFLGVIEKLFIDKVFLYGLILVPRRLINLF